MFGLFVAFSQWLLPYYVNVYNTSLVLGGLLASAFSLPGGILRAVGGFLSDKFGARKVMYWAFITTTICSFLLIIPKMDIFTAGRGIQASKKGTITMVSPTTITIDNNTTYTIKEKQEKKCLQVYAPLKNFGKRW
ncbi:MAG: MFS transporter [Chitinophagaceae bacterium]